MNGLRMHSEALAERGPLPGRLTWSSGTRSPELLPRAQGAAPSSPTCLSHRRAPGESQTGAPVATAGASTEARPSPSFVHLSLLPSINWALSGPSPSTECQTILSAQPSALHTPSSCLLCPLSSWAPSDGITGVHRCQAPSLLFYRWEAEAQPAGGICLRSPWKTGWTAQESRALRPGLHSCLPLGIPSPSPCVTVPSSWLPPHCLPASSSSLCSCHSPRVGVEGWNCTGRLGWWEVLLGSEPGGGTATYIGFCSGYFGRWRSPRPAAPSSSGVRYSPTMVLGVCITFARPGPIKPGLLITLGPCPPPAPKAEAQAGLFSSAKTSMTSLDGSDVSVLQNPARKGREKASRRMGQELSSTHGAGPGSSVHSIFSLQPHSAGLVPCAWMGRQHKDVRCYVTYYSKPGPGAGSGSSSFIR